MSDVSTTTTLGGAHELQPVELVEVRIETRQGSQYVLPDMARTALERMLTKSLASVENLTLVNVSGAVLVLPTRIIQRLTVAGDLWWKAP